VYIRHPNHSHGHGHDELEILAHANFETFSPTPQPHEMNMYYVIHVPHRASVLIPFESFDSWLRTQEASRRDKQLADALTSLSKSSLANFNFNIIKSDHESVSCSCGMLLFTASQYKSMCMAY
jgi:hypothetical protein